MLPVYNIGSEAIETVYIYEEWLKEYNRWETKRRIRQRTEFLCFMKQRLSGVVMAAIGIVAPFLLVGCATFSIFAFSLGILLLLTKEKL